MKIRLTGTGWDGEAGYPKAGDVVEVTKVVREGEWQFDHERNNWWAHENDPAWGGEIVEEEAAPEESKPEGGLPKIDEEFRPLTAVSFTRPKAWAFSEIAPEFSADLSVRIVGDIGDEQAAEILHRFAVSIQRIASKLETEPTYLHPGIVARGF